MERSAAMLQQIAENAVTQMFLSLTKVGFSSEELLPVAEELEDSIREVLERHLLSEETGDGD